MTTALIIVGLLLRCAGLPFNGIGDLDELIFKWGSDVQAMGLAHAFSEGYGLFSYALFGLVTPLAGKVPAVWWLPYKVIVLLFDLATLALLMKMGGRARRRFVLWVYWVNPFFALQSGWLGYWDGPHSFFALAAAAVLAARSSPPANWLAAGLLIGASSMFKPQGFFYFLPPLALFCFLKFVLENEKRRPTAFLAGFMAVPALSTVYLVAGGAPVMAIPLNLRSTVYHMPSLCNECFNIWRPVTRILQLGLDQPGPTIMLSLPPALSRSLHALVAVTVLSFLGYFVVRFYQAAGADSPRSATGRPAATRSIRLVGCGLAALALMGLLRPSDPTQHPELYAGLYSPFYAHMLLLLFGSGGLLVVWPGFVLGIMNRLLRTSPPPPGGGRRCPMAESPFPLLYLLVFPALVIPQFATRSHENHTVAALILLIPLLFAVPRLRRYWWGMVGIHTYAYLATFGVGRNVLVPGREYRHAADLVARVTLADSTEMAQRLQNLQATVNGWLASVLNFEPAISILSALQAVLTLLVLRELFVATSTGTP